MVKRKTKHELLIEAAQQAIEALFSDTSVSQTETASDLRDIIDDCRMKIESMGSTSDD